MVKLVWRPHFSASRRKCINPIRIASEILLSHQLCNARQPDDEARRCIRYLNHEGPHQSFVAEWNDGDREARRRRAQPVEAAPKQDSSRRAKKRPKRRQFR